MTDDRKLGGRLLETFRDTEVNQKEGQKGMG